MLLHLRAPVAFRLGSQAARHAALTGGQRSRARLAGGAGSLPSASLAWAGLPHMPWPLCILSAGKMLGRERTSLNALAFESTCKLVEGVLAAGVNLAEAYIDALGDTTKHRVGSRSCLLACCMEQMLAFRAQAGAWGIARKTPRSAGCGAAAAALAPDNLLGHARASLAQRDTTCAARPSYAPLPVSKLSAQRLCACMLVRRSG